MRRVLTGDRPTGPLHLGHYVGTLANRVALQETHEVFILVADYHLLTTAPSARGDLELQVRENVLGNLAVGVDPARATIYRQSDVPLVAELFLYLSMLVSVPRAMRIPTLKDKVAGAGMAPSYGLLGYPILQAADILMLKGELVPVGRDQASHVELAREIARTLRREYRVELPEPRALVPEAGLLPGTDGRPKMGRSLGNAINLFDDEAEVTRKVTSMYTDPTRIRASDPGHVEGNPVFAYLDAFDPDGAEVAALKDRYRAGRVGDVALKRRLAAALNGFLDPIRARRTALLLDNPRIVDEILAAGAARARSEAKLTLEAVRAAIGLRPRPGRPSSA